MKHKITIGGVPLWADGEQLPVVLRVLLNSGQCLAELRYATADYKPLRRKMVKLLHEAGWVNRDIATVLNISRHTVKRDLQWTPASELFRAIFGS